MAGGRIVLSTVGSQGDLNPFIALAIRLKAEGFDPILAGADIYGPKVEAAGVKFHAVRPSAEDTRRDTGLTDAEIAAKVMSASTLFIVETFITPYLDAAHEDLTQALEGADLVIASSFAISARIAAEAKGLPVVSILLSPMLFFSAYDPPLLAEAPWFPTVRRVLGVGGARLALAGAKPMMWHLDRPVRAFRRRLGLPPRPGSEMMDRPLQGDAVICLYSPVFGAPPPDAPPQTIVGGYAFYDSDTGAPQDLDVDLAVFLADGPPPLVFTLGSFAVYAPGRFYEDSVEVARELGRRAVLLVGSEGYERLAPLADDDIFVARYAPHSLIFPQAEAVIHHGGIGTVGQALRAGVPQLVTPVLGDQFDNAERLVRLGVARRLDLDRYRVDRAARALDDLLGHDDARNAAQALAPRVDREDGAAVVVQAVRDLLAARRAELSPAAPGSASR